MEYREFLASKRVRAECHGFEAPADVGPGLFDWQRLIVRWALRLGRAAIFADCGLGKTCQQLVWADAVARHTGRPVLVLAPLAVGPQTVREGEKFGVPVTACKTQADVRPGVNVTNYQKLLGGHFDAGAFGGVVLDESSILKNFMGKTKRLLVDAFAGTPYRLACTATPAPNDHMELGNHAEFLGVMPSNEMLSRWFIADQANCGHYRLKGHAESDFWRWVCSWAVCVGSPRDLGYDDAGFVLPPLEYRQHVATVDITADAGETLFRTDSLTATSLHREMRRTASSRAAKVAELVRASGEGVPWVIWCNTNYEADAVRVVLPEAVEVRGSEADDAKERKLTAFGRGEFPVLLSKPSICGHGLNWQHCRNLAFVGLSYSQEQFYQAVRRSWRFGQTEAVRVHVVTAETEGEVLATIRRKEEDQSRMQAAMRAAMRSATLEGERMARELIEVPHEVAAGKSWTLHLGDCVDVVRKLEGESVDLSVFSPPFAGLYIYSEAMADMGNSQDDEEFFEHFGYLAPELLRVTVPGRLCVVHCKDLPRYAGRDGTAGLKDFPGEIVRLFSSHGWSYHSRVTIWKCPVVERERTNNNGLLHKTIRRDSSQVRQGMADYLIVFRRPPREEDGLMSAKPIVRPNGIEGYHGDSDPRHGKRADMPGHHRQTEHWTPHPSPFARHPSNDDALAVWQRYAEPVWWDIDQMDTLNEKVAREASDERHICPLQLGVVRRCLHLWSNPGDVVLSPFAGIGSEGVVSVEEGRRFVGVELKRAYWLQAQRYLAGAEERAGQRGLFDGLEVA